MNQDKESNLKNPPLVSIIIPCYNGEKFIAEAIESIINQTYQNWELIIINDGSTDKSEKIIKQYCRKDNRIKYKKNSKNKGIPATRNIGIKASNGEYIALLDQDDLWINEKLEMQMKEYLKASKRVGLLFGNIMVINVINKSKRIKKPININFEEISSEELFKKLYFNNFITSITVILRKECLEKIGLFNERIKWGGDDYELWLRIAKYYKFKYINQILATRREHTNNYSSTEKSVEGNIELVNNIDQINNIPKNLKNKKIAFQLYRLARLNHLKGNYPDARKYYLISIKKSPFLNIKIYLFFFLSLFKFNISRQRGI
jgi:glycosyltransferase involved in cell wall biosynthesis